MVDYVLGGVTLPEHPGWANTKSSVSRVSRERMLYRNECTPKAEKRVMWRPKQSNMS